MTLVQSLKDEGHEVLMHIATSSCRKVGDGLVFKTDELSEMAQQADVILFAENGRGFLADQWRAAGYKVWNGGKFAEKLEYDRVFGMKAFSDAGVIIPETYEVESIGDVRAVMASEFRERERAVIKLDSSQFAGSCFSFVAEDRQQLLEQVDHWVADGLLGDKWSGIIQRFVKGIEISIEAWWNGSSWSMHNLTIEEKKLLTGNLGPNVGCAFNTVAAISPNSRLFKLVLEPLSGLLAKSGYVGQIDVNSIVDEVGIPHALEFTSRCGYDATPTLAWGHPSGYGHAIASALGIQDGEFQKHERRGTFWCGVRVHVPPYPFDCRNSELAERVNREAEGVPLLVPDEVAGDFYLYDVTASEDGLHMAGSVGIAGIAMGGGDTVQDAGKRAYKVADLISLPNKSYRADDGFHRASSQIDMLTDMRLIRVMD